MTTIDIRENAQEITSIQFADALSKERDCIAYRIYKDEFSPHIHLQDGEGDYVFIEDKEHAYNLIKALHKAIELGWLK